MITYIDGGESAFSTAVFGETSPETVHGLRRRLETSTSRLTDAGRDFFSTSMEIFNRYNSDSALERARNMLKKINDTTFHRDYIRELTSLADIQSASIEMQRWMMANKKIRQRYHRKMCDGYSGSYVDSDPGLVGRDHYDYRRVMNGIVEEVTSDNPEECGFRYTNYHEELRPGDRELTIGEKRDIHHSWSLAELILDEEADDPVSPHGNML